VLWKKQIVSIVIMLDGFNENQSFYKESVIDLLQTIRQTEVEQLWINTQLHQREELEDTLLQLYYTIELFLKKNKLNSANKCCDYSTCLLWEEISRTRKVK